MIRAILFDMGGTLDGDGLHWLDRFAKLYGTSGTTTSIETIRGAFDDAERRAAEDDTIATCGLASMVERHVDWQLEHLRQSGAVGVGRQLRAQLIDGFIAPIRATAALTARLLSDLAARGLRLGVVSNGCGNVHVLCDELGYSPYLSIIVDSRRVGLYKPDPAIFIYAAAKLGERPPNIMMVGDSFDRDVRPAHSVGMTTAWLEGPVAQHCPDPSLVGVRLRTLGELPAVIESISNARVAPERRATGASETAAPRVSTEAERASRT